MLDFDLLKDCYGCGACVNVCPRGAVHMTQAADGSYIPEIDEARCIGCGRCDRVCIHQHADKNHTPLGKEGCYAAYQLDTQARKASASGGMFFPLAQEMLRQGGYVCGCMWNEQMDAVHIVSNKLEDVERMRSSKYVQKAFLANTLKVAYAPNDSIAPTADVEGLGLKFNYYNTLNETHYAATHPEILLPATDHAICAMQYESGASAAVAFKSGNGSTFTMGFPFECIKDERLRSQLMAGILKYLTEE